jgi:hypothetical protein|mmetsp:Transcript_2602/g.7638  ORF Transcript_2602/g.7638 Transcript_2602/m.7638 type:complete len:86 (+) Transcript_2602:92-349(+)
MTSTFLPYHLLGIHPSLHCSSTKAHGQDEQLDVDARDPEPDALKRDGPLAEQKSGTVWPRLLEPCTTEPRNLRAKPPPPVSRRAV